MDTNINKNKSVVRLSEKACDNHKPNELDYLAWQDWADQKIKLGQKQKQCVKCGRWYFESEM